MRFSKDNAAEMGRKGVAAKRRRPKDFRAFAEKVMTDPKVQARILSDARNGKLQPHVIALLASHFAGKPKDAPPPPPPPPTWTAEALDRLTRGEREEMVRLARKALGREAPRMTTAEDNRRIEAEQTAGTWRALDLPPA